MHYMLRGEVMQLKKLKTNEVTPQGLLQEN